MRRPCVWIPCLLGLVAIAGCQQSAPPEENAAAEPATDVSVTVAPIVRTTLHGYVAGRGTVQPESATASQPPASAAVAAPVAGQIAGIQCHEGQRVRQGETLFRLDARVADVAVERARQAVAFAESVVQRQEQLGPGQATSLRAFQDAKQQLMAAQAELSAAEVQRQFLDVRAPIDGTVTRINAKLGDAIDPATILAELIDLSRLVVNAAIRSADVPRVRPGQRVQISPGATPGDAVAADTFAATTVEAAVEYIGASIDSANDTVLVRARVPSSAGLRPGQFVNVRILTEERPDQLAAPVDSIVQGSDGPEVAIVQGDMAIRTRVTTGLQDGGLIQIEGTGVREGLSVVVRGAYGLPPETKITVVDR